MERQPHRIRRIAAARSGSQIMAAELGSLPGLNGRWWFDETPWLIPSARASLAGAVPANASPRQTEGDLSSDARWLWEPNIRAVQDRLVELLLASRDRLTPAESALVGELLAVSRQGFDDEQLAARLR